MSKKPVQLTIFEKLNKLVICMFFVLFFLSVYFSLALFDV